MNLSISPGKNNVGAYINDINLKSLDQDQATEIKKILNETNNNLSIGILENGISVRFLGSSSQDARKCFFCIWKQIRSVCGFCEPKYQGVWPLQDSMNY